MIPAGSLAASPASTFCFCCIFGADLGHQFRDDRSDTNPTVGAFEGDSRICALATGSLHAFESYAGIHVTTTRRAGNLLTVTQQAQQPPKPLLAQEPEPSAPEEFRQFREFQRFREVMQVLEQGPW